MTLAVSLPESSKLAEIEPKWMLDYARKTAYPSHEEVSEKLEGSSRKRGS